MIADGGRDEADLVGTATPLGGLREDVLGGDGTGRIGGFGGPPEAAALRASARDLNEQTVAHLGIGRPDGGRRAKHVLINKKLCQLGLATFESTAECTFFWIDGGERAADTFWDAELVW